MTRKPDPTRDRLGADSSAWSRTSDRRSPPREPSDDGSTPLSRAKGKTAPTLSLKGRALAHLARREHSRTELQRKLGPHAESDEALERTLDDLAARGFLSDARVVESVLHQRSPRMGSARLRQELQRKGIASDLSTPALAALSDSEADRAWSLWLGKFGHRSTWQAHTTIADDADCEPRSPDERRAQQAAERLAAQKERGKQQPFLLGRGFSASVVHATLRRACGCWPDGAENAGEDAFTEAPDPLPD